MQSSPTVNRVLAPTVSSSATSPEKNYKFIIMIVRTSSFRDLYTTRLVNILDASRPGGFSTKQQGIFIVNMIPYSLNS